MKRFAWYVFLLSGVLLVATCRRPSEQPYQAPRNPGESILSWTDASSASSVWSCPFEQLECNPYYLGTKEHWEGLPVRATVLYQYVALLDFDYDNTDLVSLDPDGSPYWTRLKVRSVLEEYVNLIPGKKWENIVFDGECDQKGHCVVHEGSIPMPLWSGVSVVFGRVTCPTLSYSKYNVWISEAYAVEDGKIYDFFGFAYDWNEMREALIKTGESDMRPEACSPQPPVPTPPPSNEGASRDIIIAPLPDAEY